MSITFMCTEMLSISDRAKCLLAKSSGANIVYLHPLYVHVVNFANNLQPVFFLFCFLETKLFL